MLKNKVLLILLLGGTLSVQGLADRSIDPIDNEPVDPDRQDEGAKISITSKGRDITTDINTPGNNNNNGGTSPVQNPFTASSGQGGTSVVLPENVTISLSNGDGVSTEVQNAINDKIGEIGDIQTQLDQSSEGQSDGNTDASADVQDLEKQLVQKLQDLSEMCKENGIGDKAVQFYVDIAKSAIRQSNVNTAVAKEFSSESKSWVARIKKFFRKFLKLDVVNPDSATVGNLKQGIGYLNKELESGCLGSAGNCGKILSGHANSIAQAKVLVFKAARYVWDHQNGKQDKNFLNAVKLVRDFQKLDTYNIIGDGGLYELPVGYVKTGDITELPQIASARKDLQAATEAVVKLVAQAKALYRTLSVDENNEVIVTVATRAKELTRKQKEDLTRTIKNYTRAVNRLVQRQVALEKLLQKALFGHGFAFIKSRIAILNDLDETTKVTDPYKQTLGTVTRYIARCMNYIKDNRNDQNPEVIQNVAMTRKMLEQFRSADTGHKVCHSNACDDSMYSSLNSYAGGQ